MVEKKEQLKELLRNTNALLGAMRKAAPLLTNANVLDMFKLDKIKGSADFTWIEQKELFARTYSNIVLLKSLLERAIGYAEDETHDLIDFLQTNLRKVIFVTPEREVEIQVALEALMVGRGMRKGTDYDRKTGRAKTSGKEFVPDFILPNLKLCLEVKLSKSSDKLKVMADEINADIRAYSTGYQRQLYIVYDLGTIRDEAEFKRGLENAPGISVVIVKH